MLLYKNRRFKIQERLKLTTVFNLWHDANGKLIKPYVMRGKYESTVFHGLIAPSVFGFINFK